MTTATLPEIEVNSAGENLAQKTVCVTVSFGILGNSRKVSNSAVEVDADKSLIKVSKTLLDSPELDAIRKADGEIRRYLYNLCLPFEVGIYLLPNPLITTVETELRKYRGKRERMIEKFLEAYPRLCRKASEELRSLYNPKDYPSDAVVRSKFYFDWSYISFGTPEALRQISREMFETEREKAAQKMEQASEEITAVMRASLAQLVSHLRERLTPGEDGKAKILRDSAVTNLSDFLKFFELRNVTGDQELADLATQAKAVLRSFDSDPEVLRNITTLRERVQKEMTAVSAELDKLVTAKPSRKFRFDD